MEANYVYCMGHTSSTHNFKYIHSHNDIFSGIQIPSNGI